jgi:Cu-Zn family superoxide dismutase
MPRLRLVLPAGLAAVTALLAACNSLTAPAAAADAALGAATPAAAAGAQHAEATLHDAAGAQVGTARFTEDATGRVHVVVQVRGATPGRHGLHLHAIGACVAPATGPAFLSAGGHHNPGGHQHGHDNPLGFHAGDLPNVEVNAAGAGQLTVALGQFTLASLADHDGTALVLHQHEDDRRTNTGALGPGNSGARIACGVVTPR